MTKKHKLIQIFILHKNYILVDVSAKALIDSENVDVYQNGLNDLCSQP